MPPTYRHPSDLDCALFAMIRSRTQSTAAAALMSTDRSTMPSALESIGAAAREVLPLGWRIVGLGRLKLQVVVSSCCDIVFSNRNLLLSALYLKN
mmetsp:Transcript_3454/g.7506  ORF Transcript_3454/g.7506 Transcript_3454/m.7506 type:complete len:95 (+) Transcript_3454:2133-2417(+)